MERVYIGLGSNLRHPVEQIFEAIVFLMDLPRSQWLGVSSLYISKPHGPQDQPDFVNAVAVVDTQLEPFELLQILQDYEKRQGRVKTRHWGERVIDLDILLYGNHVLDQPDLVIPHPRMQERPFVMVPLLEVILPDAHLTEQPDVVKDYLAQQQNVTSDSEDSDLSGEL